MAQVLELRSGSLPEYDWKGGVRARRTFKVDIRPDAVPKNGTLAGLPGLNDAHPTLTNARVDQVIPGPFENLKDWSLVEVLYSSSRQFSFPVPPVDPSAFDFTSWAMDFETVIQELPVAKRISRTIPQPNGTAPVTQATWSYGPDVVLKIRETRIIYNYRLAMNFTTGGPNQPDWDAIAEQNNRIHAFGNRKYRFEAGGVTQTTPTAWEIAYSWVYDGGTARTASLINTNPVQNNRVIVPPGTVTTPGGLIRDPFAEWIVVDDTTNSNPTNYPDFYQVFPYEEDLNGWNSLPGIT